MRQSKSFRIASVALPEKPGLWLSAGALLFLLLSGCVHENTSTDVGNANAKTIPVDAPPGNTQDTLPMMPGTHIPLGECTTIYGPSCGADGKTYASACDALRAGAVIAHAGECARK